MIKIENQEVVGFEHAIRGMRNPMNSHIKSDSCFCDLCVGRDVDEGYCPIDNSGRDIDAYYNNGCFVIGNNDLDLMKRLVKAGTDHRKFMRMIVVYADITAPLYWWKEYDTYKVGTVANSCSTMHKIHEKEFALDDFSHEHLLDVNLDVLNSIINGLNNMRYNYINFETLNTPCYVEKKDYWWQMIQLLPSSYNQKRTVMLNYEVLKNMYHSRKTHKLDEWHTFCGFIEQLPYAKELICNE